MYEKLFPLYPIAALLITALSVGTAIAEKPEWSGQGKKWAVGQPLRSDVLYYPVAQPVIVQLGAPPAGYKHVRVASDILLIAIGTSMIVDAVQDLGRI